MFFALLLSPGCGWKRCTKLPENYQKKDWSAKVVFFQWPPVCVLIIFFISCCLVTVMTLKAELCRLVHLVQQQNYDKILTLISHQFSSAVFLKKTSLNLRTVFVSCFSGGVFLRDVSCYFSVLEKEQPREKLECWFDLSFDHIGSFYCSCSCI